MNRPKVKPTINIKAIEASWIWQANGACRGEDSNLFYYEDNERGDHKESRTIAAKAICGTCKVQTECLEFALQINERYGIWGGTTPEERNTMKRRRQRERYKETAQQ
jgi:WhiB family redox-sensing transcriptional regulator